MPIRINTQENKVVITFNRPEIRNPLSRDVLGRLEETLDYIEADPAVEAVIFTGRDGVFASGADLREIAELTPDEAPGFARRGQELMNRIAALEPNTIAAIDGPCFGGALDLAIACSRRIASPRSTFAHPGTGLGIITGWGGTQRLPRLIGRGRALEMFFTAAPVTAARALEIGLIDELNDEPLQGALSFQYRVVSA